MTGLYHIADAMGHRGLQVRSISIYPRHGLLSLPKIIGGTLLCNNGSWTKVNSLYVWQELRKRGESYTCWITSVFSAYLEQASVIKAYSGKKHKCICLCTHRAEHSLGCWLAPAVHTQVYQEFILDCVGQAYANISSKARLPCWMGFFFISS